jgi:hypothetical protein
MDHDDCDSLRRAQPRECGHEIDIVLGCRVAAIEVNEDGMATPTNVRARGAQPDPIQISRRIRHRFQTITVLPRVRHDLGESLRARLNAETSNETPAQAGCFLRNESLEARSTRGGSGLATDVDHHLPNPEEQQILSRISLIQGYRRQLN